MEAVTCLWRRSIRKKPVVALATARSSLQVARRDFFALPGSERPTCSKTKAGRSSSLTKDLQPDAML